MSSCGSDFNHPWGRPREEPCPTALHPARKVLTPFHGSSAENRLRKGKSFEFTASRQLPVFTVSGDGFRTDAFSGLEAEDAVASQMRI